MRFMIDGDVFSVIRVRIDIITLLLEWCTIYCKEFAVDKVMAANKGHDCKGKMILKEAHDRYKGLKICVV